MAVKWKTMPLGELYDFSSGLSKQRDQFGFGHGFLSFKDVFYNYFTPEKLNQLVNSSATEQAACSIKRGDVFLTRTSETQDELGMSCVALRTYEKATFNGFTKRLRPKANSQIVPEYAGYYFRSPFFRRAVSAMSSLSTRASLNNEMLGRLAMILPPVDDQESIGEILKSLDDKIELNRRMNATLEAMARALFQSWFVDFDPVRAKLDGRKPIGLDEATAALFPEHLEDSPLGHIPKGWKATTLGACIGFGSGFSFKSQDWQESGVPVVKIGSVKPGIIDLTQVSYVSEEIAKQAARYRLSTGDMLIGMTGYVGEVGLVPPSDNPPLLNQRVGKFVMAKPGTVSLAFWYCTTRQPEFKAFVEARSHGTAQANVSGESILEFPLVMPPSGILDSFNYDCQPLFDRILSNHGESRTLATLRDTLLPRLLSGELSVYK